MLVLIFHTFIISIEFYYSLYYIRFSSELFLFNLKWRFICFIKEIDEKISKWQ